MSIRTVATQDFTSVRRSRALWAVAALLTLLFALIAYAYGGSQLPPTETVQRLFGILAMLLGLLVPIVALVASYMAIAGPRERGSIKFLLSLPNTRRDVFLGKFLSRLSVVAAGTTILFLAAAAVAVARHGVFPARTVLGLFVLTLLYGSVFVSVAVALSAAVASRSRAIAAAVGTYFLLVILFLVPGIRITAIVRWVHTSVLGLAPNPNLYDLVTYASPYTAFRKATNLVFPPEQRSLVFLREMDPSIDLPFYLSDEFSLVVFAAWLVLPLLLGYLRFERADIE